MYWGEGRNGKHPHTLGEVSKQRVVFSMFQKICFRSDVRKKPSVILNVLLNWLSKVQLNA